MKKIGLFTDVHGNIFALKTIFKCFEQYHCDSYIFCGDAVTMGPRSQECLEFLFQQKNLVMLTGNHDRDFILNLARHAPMSHTPAEHKKYVFSTIDSKFRSMMVNNNLQYSFMHGNKRFMFCHYALKENNLNSIVEYPFKQLVSHPDAHSMAETFDSMGADVYFFGHKHEPCDFELNGKWYVNIGSVGCHPQPLATGIVLTLDDDGSWNYERVSKAYDRQTLKEEMTDGHLPEGQYIFDFYFDQIYGTSGEKAKTDKDQI